MTTLRVLAWNDETLVPSGPLTRPALVELTDANPGLVEDWQNHHAGLDGWATYADWLREAVDVFVDLLGDEYGDDRERALRYIIRLVDELKKLES